ncbi:MAG: zinc-ribbon domain-containing protein [Deltaproteobacteria bacterium]|nr:zinc-ribbon domain-containing protein [Deltaproteobacteria bacterium]
MRIQCENCDATYTIDDAQLSDQPIGAQCPYCGHVKLVRRGDGGGAPAYAPPAPPSVPSYGGGSASPFGGSGPMSSPFGAPSSPPAFGGGPSTGFGGSAPTSGGYSNPPAGFGGGTPFGGSSPSSNPFGGGSPFGTGPAVGGLSSNDLISADLSSDDLGRRPGGGGRLASDLAVPAAGAGPGGDARCQVCGTPLTDEFDKVIGLCDEHQRDRRSDDVGGLGADTTAHWHVRTASGLTEGPMNLEDLRNQIRNGVFSVADEFSNDGIQFGAISRYKELAYLASLATAETRSPPRPTAVGVGRPRPSVGRLLTPALLVVLLGGVGFLAYQQRAVLIRLYTGMTQGGGTKGPVTPNPLKRYLATWRLRHPDLTGSPSEHLATARARHLEDTQAGYQAAERAYERALLLNENEPEAIAGYVENLALWRYESATLDELRVAEAAANYAREVDPNAPGPFRAQAALALAKGDLNGCRAGADGALQRAATDGRAKLLLAGCYLQGNVQLAISEAERAKQLLPELRRADRLLARAYAEAGRFTAAFKVLDQRLKAEPDNSALHLEYGDIAKSLAEYDLAEEHLRRAASLPGDPQGAYLAQAELAYERGDFAGAASLFDRAARERAMHGVRAAKVYAGWASAELMRSRAPRAIQLADQALGFVPSDAAALLVRGQASLLTGSATTAEVYARRTLDARAGEPSALVLSARAAAALRQNERAIKSLDEAIQNDPRDPRLKGILAALYLSVGGSPQAYALMRRAAEIDPLEADARNRVGPLALSAIPVREALAQFRKSAAEERNASVASSAMGMLYYHLGDRARANTAIARALRLDSANVAALIYDAQLALDRNDERRAEASAQKLLAVERGSALGHLLLGRALAQGRDVDRAHAEFEAALRSNPGLLAAKIEMAGLGIEGGDRERAIEELLTAFRVDPHNLRVRRLLYKAGI